MGSGMCKRDRGGGVPEGLRVEEGVEVGVPVALGVGVPLPVGVGGGVAMPLSEVDPEAAGEASGVRGFLLYLYVAGD